MNTDPQSRAPFSDRLAERIDRLTREAHNAGVMPDGVYRRLSSIENPIHRRDIAAANLGWLLDCPQCKVPAMVPCAPRNEWLPRTTHGLRLTVIQRAVNEALGFKTYRVTLALGGTVESPQTGSATFLEDAPNLPTALAHLAQYNGREYPVLTVEEVAR